MIRSHVKDLACGNPFRMRGSVRTPSARPRDSDISAVQATGWIRMGEWTELMRPRVQHESPGMPASYSQAPLDSPGTKDASWRIRSQDTIPCLDPAAKPQLGIQQRQPTGHWHLTQTCPPHPSLPQRMGLGRVGFESRSERSYTRPILRTGTCSSVRATERELRRQGLQQAPTVWPRASSSVTAPVRHSPGAGTSAACLTRSAARLSAPTIARPTNPPRRHMAVTATSRTVG